MPVPVERCWYLDATNPIELLKPWLSFLTSPSWAWPFCSADSLVKSSITITLYTIYNYIELLNDTFQGTYERHLVCDTELGLFQGSKMEEDFPEASQSGSMVATGLESTQVQLQTHLRKGKHTPECRLAAKGHHSLSEYSALQNLISTHSLVSHFSRQLFIVLVQRPAIGSYCWQGWSKAAISEAELCSSQFCWTKNKPGQFIPWSRPRKLRIQTPRGTTTV